MSSKKTITILVSLSTLFTVSAHAFENKPRYYVVPSLSYGLMGKKADVDNTAVVGLGLGYKHDDTVSFQLTGRWIPTEWESNGKNVHGGLYTANVFRHFKPNSKIEPFLKLGLGFQHLDTLSERTKMFVVNAGFGADYNLTEKTALRFTAEDAFTPDNDDHTGIFGVGFVYRFGKTNYHQSAVVEPFTQTTQLTEVETTVDTVAATCDMSKIGAIKNVYFENDSTSLSAKDKALLDTIASCLQNNPELNLNLAGYASKPGSDQYNYNLAGRRGNVVESYLISKGIDKNRLTTKSYGKAFLLSERTDEQAQNRRVELKTIA